MGLSNSHLPRFTQSATNEDNKDNEDSGAQPTTTTTAPAPRMKYPCHGIACKHKRRTNEPKMVKKVTALNADCFTCQNFKRSIKLAEALEKDLSEDEELRRELATTIEACKTKTQ